MKPRRLIIERQGTTVRLILELRDEYAAILMADGLIKELNENGCAAIELNGAMPVESDK